MELLNNIWTALTTPNETLMNIILMPSTVIEIFFTFIIFTTLLKISATRKQTVLYVSQLDNLFLNQLIFF